MNSITAKIEVYFDGEMLRKVQPEEMEAWFRTFKEFVRRVNSGLEGRVIEAEVRTVAAGWIQSVAPLGVRVRLSL